MPESVSQSDIQETHRSQGLSPGFRRHYLWRLLQMMYQLIFVVWFRFRATGQENLPPNSGALLLSNHQSFLDPAIVGVSLKRPVSYLARDSLFGVPVIGWILRNMHVMPINRKTAGTESIRLSLNRMKDDFLVGIFPEGTRTRNGDVGKLKPGFIAIARRSKLPIIPVGICGAYRAMPRGSFLIYPVKVSVHFGPALDPAIVQELSQRGREDEFVEYVSRHIREAVDQAAKK